MFGFGKRKRHITHDGLPEVKGCPSMPEVKPVYIAKECIILEVYLDKGKRYRWRFRDLNDDKILVNGAQAWKDRVCCIAEADRFVCGVRVIERKGCD